MPAWPHHSTHAHSTTFVAGPFEIDVEVAFGFGLVDNGAIHEVREHIGELREGNFTGQAAAARTHHHTHVAGFFSGLKLHSPLSGDQHIDRHDLLLAVDSH